MKPSKTGKPLPKSQLDFESFSLRPLRYISKYIFMANLRFVYCKSALKLGTVAVRILLENASFRQALKPVRTSKLAFPRVIWRHPAKHPLGFRVVLVTTTSIHLHIHSYIIIAKSHRSVNTFCRRSPQRQRGPLVRDERKPLPPSVGWGTLPFLSASGAFFFMLYCLLYRTGQYLVKSVGIIVVVFSTKLLLIFDQKYCNKLLPPSDVLY